MVDYLLWNRLSGLLRELPDGRVFDIYGFGVQRMDHEKVCLKGRVVGGKSLMHTVYLGLKNNPKLNSESFI